jgi:micrococcal nuclease
MELYNYKAHIIKVYDGDTVTALIDLGCNVKITEKIRLADVDTPELRGEERESGLISRDWLREKILDKDVLLHTNKDKKGKYGRYIGTIFLAGETVSINEQIINEGLGKLY